MSEERARDDAKTCAAYLTTLVQEGIDLNSALNLAASYIAHIRIAAAQAEAIKPKKEPWET